MCRTYALPGAPALFNVSGGRNGSSESAGSSSSDKFEFAFGSRPVFVGRVGCQWSNYKPICDLLPTVEPKRRPNNHRSNLQYSSSLATSNGNRSLQLDKAFDMPKSDTRQSSRPQDNRHRERGL